MVVELTACSVQWVVATGLAASVMRRVDPTERFRKHRSENRYTRELISARNTYQVQQQKRESPTVTLTRYACKHKVRKLHHRYSSL